MCTLGRGCGRIEGGAVEGPGGGVGWWRGRWMVEGWFKPGLNVEMDGESGR